MDKLTLPIYLNQKYVFDLLAIVEDGFSQVETIRTGQNNSGSEKDSFKGEVGLSNVFAFLKFGLNGDSAHEKSSQTNHEISKEKIHTPNSLFSKLRSYLHGNKSIITEGFLTASPGDFVEIKLSLRKNPLIDALEGFSSLMKMALLFDDTNTTSIQPNKHQPKQNKNPNQKILDQIDSMSNQLKAEGSLDLIGTATGADNFQVVLTLDRAFLGDLSLSDIADGHFSVLGKITKVIPETSNESVNLLRKTSLSKLNSALLEQMFSGFAQMEEHGIKNQNIETEIKSPVIQLIPIAIFA